MLSAADCGQRMKPAPSDDDRLPLSMPNWPLLLQPAVDSSIERGTLANVIECLPTAIGPAGGTPAAGDAGLRVGVGVGDAGPPTLAPLKS